VRGTNGSNTLRTYGGNDDVWDRKGDDKVELGAGNDYVRVGGGKDEFDGGSGKDYISYYDSTGGVTLDLQANTASGSWASNDEVENFESASGSRTGGDEIYGTDGSNTIKTFGGNDRVWDRKGTDRVELGSGNDYVRVGGGKDNFDGGSGKDYISYYDSTGGVTLNLGKNTASGSWAANDTIKGFESASGSETGDDKITGTNGSNTIKTFGGDDDVWDLSGDDRVELGSGDDYVRVGGGKDSFDGGSGVDYISYYDSTGGVKVDLRSNATSKSWASNDTIKNFEGVSGSKTGADDLRGTETDNVIRGYGGNDVIHGRGGNDKLYGGDGNDYFDTGGGNDTVWGGDGADTFHFDEDEDGDVIKDFQNNIDELEFHNLPGINTTQEVLNFATQQGTDVYFDFGDGITLLVENITKGQLENDIVFA
jgi:Ca2+-binding RTX toxin-like protein